MIRLARLLSSGLVLVVLLLAGRSLVALGAPNVTNVCGALANNTTWTAVSSPYEVCIGGVTVNPGVTLTIQPGVTVQFQANSRLTAKGVLTALGTPGQPITFTGVSATPGSWRGILVESLVTTPAVASLAHVILDYGGDSGYYGGQVYANDADLSVTDGLIRNGLGSGIFHEGNGEFEVHDTHFEGNAHDVIRMTQASLGIDLSGLSATGNGRDVVYIAGTTYLEGQQHWPAPGIPYIINGGFGNTQGDSLTIDPGNELQFTSSSYINIGGEFKAIGLPGAPITLTGVVKTPGSWDGLYLYGGQTPANGQLERVTIEYAGRSSTRGNITVENGYLVARHSIIRFSQFDGVRFNSGGRGSIMNSQITDNTQYGVRNLVTTRWVLASNNWWGDPAGPTSDTPACSPGQGDRVSNGVLFRPVVTDTQSLDVFPLTAAPILTLTPRRWFAPANNITQVYFDITLRDGNGLPLPGRVVHLSSSLGTATDGGITDANGHTLATLVSGALGDAEVTAVADLAGCDGALSPTARVTFTPPISLIDLFPNAPSPYLDGGIRVSPMPVIAGVASTMAVTLTNPLSVPITVDVEFGFAQSGIGLAFGPIRDFVGQVIPAHSSVELSANWVPPVTGHFCVQVRYTITAVDGVRIPRAADEVSTVGLENRNLDALPAAIAFFYQKGAAEACAALYNLMVAVPSRADFRANMVPHGWRWMWFETSQDGLEFGTDPPRQDYDQITQRAYYSLPPVQPGAGVSAARAAALNAVSAALADVTGALEAVVLANDRFGGASAAQDLTWAAQQANARLDYQEQTGGALLQYADSLEALVQVLSTEGVTQVVISASEVISYQQSLATQGFTPEEIAEAHLAGLTDAEIEALRQNIIAADPNEVAGDVIARYADLAGASRAFGQALLTPYTFQPGSGVSGGIGAASGPAAGGSAGNTLAQVNNSSVTIQVGNPLTQTALIELRPRRIDLPADWAVSVSPAQVSLAPGEQTTVTVTVFTGSLVPQNTIPRVAVEGYASGQFLGGVVVDIVVPKYVIPLGFNDVYVPLVQR